MDCNPGACGLVPEAGKPSPPAQLPQLRPALPSSPAPALLPPRSHCPVRTGPSGPHSCCRGHLCPPDFWDSRSSGQSFCGLRGEQHAQNPQPWAPAASQPPAWRTVKRRGPPCHRHCRSAGRAAWREGPVWPQPCLEPTCDQPPSSYLGSCLHPWVFRTGPETHYRESQ